MVSSLALTGVGVSEGAGVGVGSGVDAGDGVGVNVGADGGTALGGLSGVEIRWAQAERIRAMTNKAAQQRFTSRSNSGLLLAI